jgi:hypothetical protein
LLPNPILSFSRRASLPATPEHPDDKNGGVKASQVSSTGTCGAVSYPPAPAKPKCATQHPRELPVKDLHTKGAASPFACHLHTTLVLERRTPDFSTGAGNSALIVNNEISAQPLVPISVYAAAKKKNDKKTTTRFQS